MNAGRYAFVWIDALTQKVREGGRTVSLHALVKGASAQGGGDRPAGRRDHAS
ncbi:hypothetical protein [Streptosporangium sp. NPDC001681]|uniref:hypothetical protein n=1 Tax=Streptosporangium sp. NPDC001681 TaxID=3154395 RepID=UPI00332F08F9